MENLILALVFIALFALLIWGIWYLSTFKEIQKKFTGAKNDIGWLMSQANKWGKAMKKKLGGKYSINHYYDMGRHIDDELVVVVRLTYRPNKKKKKRKKERGRNRI